MEEKQKQLSRTFKIVTGILILDASHPVHVDHPGKERS